MPSRDVPPFSLSLDGVGEEAASTSTGAGGAGGGASAEGAPPSYAELMGGLPPSYNQVAPGSGPSNTCPNCVLFSASARS